MIQLVTIKKSYDPYDEGEIFTTIEINMFEDYNDSLDKCIYDTCLEFLDEVEETFSSDIKEQYDDKTVEHHKKKLKKSFKNKNMSSIYTRDFLFSDESTMELLFKIGEKSEIKLDNTKVKINNRV